VVQFFHEVWGHANEQQMTWIVQNELFDAIPKELTVAAVHKYYPSCKSCVKGNLKARPIPSNRVDRELEIGQECEIDIKVWTQRSFSGANLSLTATDSKTGFMHGYFIPGKKKLLAKIKEISAEYTARGHPMKVLRVDNEFHTTEIKAWCKRKDVNIHMLPCIPYKHNTTKKVERRHQTLGDRVVTALDLPHLSDKYVAYAYYDVMRSLNNMPTLLNPKSTPHIEWWGSKVNLRETPMFPFGSAIRIGIPLPLQTTVTGRSADGVYVGVADGHKWGVKIYNTLTSKVVIRSDFKVMGPEPCISPLLRVPVLWEAVDEHVSDNPSFYGADMGSLEPVASVAADPVGVTSDTNSDPHRQIVRGTDASRDLSTGDSVLLNQTELINDVHSSHETQKTNSSLNTDDDTAGVTDESLARVVVADTSDSNSDPHRQIVRGTDASRDLSTGEPVMLKQSNLNENLELISCVDTEPTTLCVDIDKNVGMVLDTAASVGGVIPVAAFDTASVTPIPNPCYQDVEVLAILSHTGVPQKRSAMHFQVQWANGHVTWKKYSTVKDCVALDEYIKRHPDLEVLNPPPPAVDPGITIPQRQSDRLKLRKRLHAHLEAFRTGEYNYSETESGGMVYGTPPPPDDLPVPSVACALPPVFAPAKNGPSPKTRKRGAKYGTQTVPKSRRIPVHALSRRAILAAQQLDEETRPSRKALVAAQLVADEATYDPLLVRNIEAGEYSKDLLDKGLQLLEELDARASIDDKPLTAAMGNIPLSPSSVPLTPVPLSVSQALHSLEWESWMNVTSVELESLKKMSVWHTPKIPFYDIPKQKIIPSKIIFARKYNADGTFQKYKARLCARGDRWQEALGVETYAGTVKSESIKLLLGIAAEENFEICCVDVETAFLHSPLPSDQTIYMRRPVGLTDLDMPEIVELDKCIYGLPQASNRFREHSDGVLRKLGFTPTISDPCVYVMYKNGGRVYALIHVDDIGLIGTTVQLLTEVKTGLSATYTLKETDMSNYLGMHIVRDRPGRSIKLLQTGYVDSLVLKYGPELQEYPSTPSTPMLPVPGTSPPLSPLLGKKDITEYQGMVGSLMYLASQTRPDILYAVCAHARFSRTPTVDNRKGVIRILSYISCTRDLGLKLFSGEGIVLYATVDASYACHTDLKSHTGCTLHLGRNSGSVFSLSKKQTVTADSSTVAELIAAHLAAHEIMWARNFLSELGYPQIKPTTLFEDNMSTISLIVNKGNGQRSKHIDLRYNFVREQVVEKVLAIIHLSGVDMTSDILTKPLGPTAFLHLRPKLLGMAAAMSNNQLKKFLTHCQSFQIGNQILF
jgi:hypothetical protein